LVVGEGQLPWLLRHSLTSRRLARELEPAGEVVSALMAKGMAVSEMPPLDVAIGDRQEQ
jgi:hypothetical protein